MWQLGVYDCYNIMLQRYKSAKSIPLYLAVWQKCVAIQSNVLSEIGMITPVTIAKSLWILSRANKINLNIADNYKTQCITKITLLIV